MREVGYIVLFVFMVAIGACAILMADTYSANYQAHNLEIGKARIAYDNCLRSPPDPRDLLRQKDCDNYGVEGFRYVFWAAAVTTIKIYMVEIGKLGELLPIIQKYLDKIFLALFLIAAMYFWKLFSRRKKSTNARVDDPDDYEEEETENRRLRAPYPHQPQQPTIVFLTNDTPKHQSFV